MRAGNLQGRIYSPAARCFIPRRVLKDFSAETPVAGQVDLVDHGDAGCIPTLSEWAQILLVLSMIGMTGWYSRRRYS
ncbi:MAG: IPTL-CTERM sorting domain-containing protein [Zoogloea sp.]|nr:IPTL-CTERM sorting domain-containing protein [Zoogloea sp.]